jgi:iron complex outermembrane receptor protein
MNTHLKLGLLLGTCLASAPVSVLAQTQAPVQPAPSGTNETQSVNTLDDVVVTARRREERAQDVPVAISVLNAETLKDQQVRTTADLTTNVPNVIVAPSSYGTSTPKFSFRGQHQVENLINVDASVGLYFAEFVLQRPQGTNFALTDLASVQVLKGPQGTLFGKNSTGGAVLITPQRPDFDGFSGELTAGLGNYNLHTTSAVVNAPLSDTLALRLAVSATDHDGYIKNLAPGGRDLADEHGRSARLSLRYRSGPVDSNTIYQYVNSRDQGMAYRLVTLNPAVPIFNTYPQLLAPVRAQFDAQSGDFFSVFSDNPYQSKVDASTITNTTTWDLGWATLKNIVGYRHFTFQGGGEFDGVSVKIPPIPAGTDFPIYGTVNTSNTSQWSEELQISGTSLGDRLNWITGIYFFGEESLETFATTNGGASVGFTRGDGENKSQSIFAQATYKLTDRLSVTGGVRQTWDQREITTYATLQTLPNQTTANCRIRLTGNVTPADCLVKLEYENDAPSWTVSLDYKITDDDLIYLAHRRGYRSGGVSNRHYVPSDPETFRPEQVDDIELGLKTTNYFGSVPVRFNANIFYQDYKDIQRQISVVDPATNLVATAVFNAAAATIKGAELELTVVPVTGLTLSAHYGYTDPEYKSFNNPITGVPLLDNVGQPLASHQFAFVAKHSGGANIRYEFPASNLGEFAVNASYSYLSSYPVSENSVPGEAGGYSLVNASATWSKIMGTEVGARVFANNLLNEEYAVAGVSLYTVGFVTQNPGSPRTFGIELNYAF